jgi:hypothetical protein
MDERQGIVLKLSLVKTTSPDLRVPASLSVNAIREQSLADSRSAARQPMLDPTIHNN